MLPAAAPEKDASVGPEAVRNRDPVRGKGLACDGDGRLPICDRDRRMPAPEHLIVERLGPQGERAFGHTGPAPSPSAADRRAKCIGRDVHVWILCDTENNEGCWRPVGLIRRFQPVPEPLGTTWDWFSGSES